MLRYSLAVLTLSVAGVHLAQEPELLRRARMVRMSSLDSTLPAVSLERWLLQQAAGAGAKVEWEVNDCGEGGDGLAAPTCVEGRVQVAPDTAAYLSLIVAGTDGESGRPEIWSLHATEGRAVTTFQSLPAWAAYLRRDPRRQVFVAESSFAASMARRDLEAFAAFVSPEAVFFADTAVLRGRDRVVEGWRRFFVGPAPFSWKPDVIEVLPSGKLAISNGPVFDPAGKKIGSFSSIWRREPDGRWLIIFDKGCA
ncbi:MAG TPA: nuclear transport factor 2 family protein [Gemmatimonadales bacterium]